jgi:cation diffusion facilitator CzcD-associated flavoprotein CzcO
MPFLRRVSTAAQILPDDIYDIVIVGGGIAGLALTTSLRTTHVSTL